MPFGFGLPDTVSKLTRALPGKGWMAHLFRMSTGEDVYVDDMFPVLNEAFWDPDEKKIFGGGGMDIADKRYGTPVFLKSDSHSA